MTWLIYPLKTNLTGICQLPGGPLKTWLLHTAIFIQITLFLTSITLAALVWPTVTSSLTVTQTVHTVANLQPVITSLLLQYSPCWQPCYPTQLLLVWKLWVASGADRLNNIHRHRANQTYYVCEGVHVFLWVNLSCYFVITCHMYQQHMNTVIPVRVRIGAVNFMGMDAVKVDWNNPKPLQRDGWNFFLWPLCLQHLAWYLCWF